MGLFEHYPGSSESTISAGDKAVNQNATLTTLESNLDGRKNDAVSEVSDDLTDEVDTVTVTPKDQSGKVSRASLLAGGAIRHFASAITIYNGHIDRLNAEYERLKGQDFNATGLCTPDGIEEPTDAAIKAAGADVRARLEKERQGFEDDLDGSADYVAGLLNGEATDEALLSLYLTGDISAGDLAGSVDIPVKDLNTLRFAVATGRFALDLPMMMNALSKYVFKVGPGGLHSLKTPAGTIDAIRQVMKQQGFSPAKAKAYIRGMNMTNAVTPGNLFSKPGLKPTTPAQIKALGAVGKVGTVLGRYVLPPASIAAGVYGAYDTWKNWDQLPTDRKVTGVVGNGAFIVAGVGGTAAATAYAMSWTFPPAGAAITAVAGTIALGCWVYDNWDGISNFVTETVPEFVTETAPQAIADGAGWVYDKSGLDSVVDGIGGAFEDGGLVDDITPW